MSTRFSSEPESATNLKKKGGGALLPSSRLSLLLSKANTKAPLNSKTTTAKTPKKKKKKKKGFQAPPRPFEHQQLTIILCLSPSCCYLPTGIALEIRWFSFLRENR